MPRWLVNPWVFLCWKHQLGLCWHCPKLRGARDALPLAPQVQCLERQNQALVAKWELLQRRSARPEDARSVASFFQAHVSNLRRQLETLREQREQLDPEAHGLLQLVQGYKQR